MNLKTYNKARVDISADLEAVEKEITATRTKAKEKLSDIEHSYTSGDYNRCLKEIDSANDDMDYCKRLKRIKDGYEKVNDRSILFTKDNKRRYIDSQSRKRYTDQDTGHKTPQGAADPISYKSF